MTESVPLVPGFKGSPPGTVRAVSTEAQPTTGAGDGHTEASGSWLPCGQSYVHLSFVPFTLGSAFIPLGQGSGEENLVGRAWPASLSSGLVTLAGDAVRVEGMQILS